jgi:DNA-binding response OmpR family regulator
MAAWGVAERPNMVVLEAEDVVQLLQSEIERAGGPMAYSKKARVDRAAVHRFLKRQKGPGKKIISALELRVVYAPKRRGKVGKDGPAIAPKKGSDIVVVEDDTPILQINGNPVRAAQAQVTLLACLCSELGCVVPYERLCRVIGHQSTHQRHMHTLRQQMVLVRRLLITHKARCFLAVAAGVGYALCEVVRG